MTDRRASCRCGQLRATASGDPVRVSVCHCRNCQKRSGSAFAAQVRFADTQVTIEGQSKAFQLASDSGNSATFHFCPDCGTEVFYVNNGKFDEQVAIPLWTFADPHAFAPAFSVWEVRKHGWVTVSAAEHRD
ncbi:GFA family protein [Sphingomonas xanthus]|uniref:GFA family protein n=1 Tax=Sphingomonas xanthus TaxID=2594473 RepID=A0A516IQZ7_9SPHN|nr:GFA family protein [Sphingomonas xanthus]QDP19311.1 GFA family protein [Sphingomonas xanthus]